MATPKKSFAKSVSLGNVFKRRKDNPYTTWEEEEDTDGAAAIPEVSRLLEEQAQNGEQLRHCPSPPLEAGDVKLADCFYLGSYSMTGLPIKGRGCIDIPAGILWDRAEEEQGQRKRKQTAKVENTDSKLKYIRLVASREELKVLDLYTGEIVAKFDYRVISFTGTHPKRTRVFAFVAQTKNDGPFCYAFKCTDYHAANQAASELSNVFQRRCTELVRAVSVNQGTPFTTGTATLVQ
eukprot:Em0018g381a